MNDSALNVVVGLLKVCTAFSAASLDLTNNSVRIEPMLLFRSATGSTYESWPILGPKVSNGQERGLLNGAVSDSMNFVVLVSFAVLSGWLSEVGLCVTGSFALHLGSYLLGAFALALRKPLLYPPELLGHACALF
jgi:hypothetical protein